MNWTHLKVSADLSHHIDESGRAAYTERFDEVLKFHAPGLAPVYLNGEAWHICPDGSAAYSRRFQRAFGYYENLSAVTSHRGWHHILPNGEDAYSYRYAWCGNFQNSRCPARQMDGDYFHILPSGQPVYEHRWKYAGDYRDGVATVQGANGLSTHVDIHGNFAHGNWFLDLDVFHKGFARARDTHGWMHIVRSGIPAYKRRFAAIEPFYNGQARVERFDGAFEVIDESGVSLVVLRPARGEGVDR